MALDPATAASTLLPATQLVAGEAAAEPMTPLLAAQLTTCLGLYGGGWALELFADVDEPEEEGAVEGEIDIYRDSPLRYLGYANECGEAFRPLVPVEVVYFTYFLAIAYILADTVDKGKKGAAAPGENSGPRAVVGASDTFMWQMLASVIFPSFCINRLVVFLLYAQAQDIPSFLQADFLPTVAGLVAIPLLITPLDVLAHQTLNLSFRKLSAALLGTKPAQKAA